jgi:phosphoenolpyruvate carboxykinase (ATP)
MEGIKRMPIKATRALLNAALDGSLNNAEFKTDPELRLRRFRSRVAGR